MANTTNFNWETPDDTDLVKDGAAAIRTLAGAIDTSLVDLKGGTTGQVLSKATGTDMDFTWVTSDDANAIQNAIVDAKGDIVAASANDTPARLAVGTDNHRLIAASGETTGLKYVADTQNTVIDAAGDLVYGTAADTLGRLAIGTAGQVLQVNSGATAPEWATPAGGGGKVLQVVSATYSTQFSTTSASFVDTGLTLNITPSLATSKVLVLMTNNMGATRATADDCYYAFEIRRDSTTIFAGNQNEGYAEANQTSNTRQIYNTDTINYLDSPATTSALTYKVRIKSVGGSTAIAQYSNDAASLILLEIGA